MEEFLVGVCQVHGLLRHAQTLKDRRRVVVSLKQQLRNHGMSVAEVGPTGDPKQICLGASLVASDAGVVNEHFQRLRGLAEQRMEILRFIHDIFDYGEGERPGIEIPGPCMAGTDGENGGNQP